MRTTYTILSVILSASVIGCAHVPKANLGNVMKAPEERLLGNYLRQGLKCEKKGDLVEALRQYQLAMTVSPRNKQAAQDRRRVERGLRKSAKQHYRSGLDLHKRGKYSQAHREYLIALRLRPDYPEVIKILTSRQRIRIKRYIVHAIKPGENLSKLAMEYYGDPHRFTIIAEYNNLTDATQIKAGQKVMIPEIEGVAFLAGKKALKKASRKGADSGSRYWKEYALRERQSGKGAGPRAKEKKDEGVKYAALYRDHGVALFKEKKYDEAIAEFGKVLNLYANDKVARKYSYEAHFQQGMGLFEDSDYLAARDQFRASSRYRADCPKCREYMERSEDLYKEIHYRNGVQFFEEEQLLEAIQEWELVEAVDTKYKTVDYLLKKARTILGNIEQIKEGQKEQR